MTTIEAPNEDGALDDRHAPAGLSQVERIDYHSRALDRAIAMTEMADEKVSPLLALVASLAAITVTVADDLSDLLSGEHLGAGGATAGWILAVIFLLSSVTAGLGAALVYLPTAPHRPRHSRRGREVRSLFYFEDIQAMPLDEYAARARTMPLDETETDVIQQAHLVSAIASRKLREVHWSFVLSTVSLVSWLGLMAMLRV